MGHLNISKEASRYILPWPPRITYQTLSITIQSHIHTEGDSQLIKT